MPSSPAPHGTQPCARRGGAAARARAGPSAARGSAPRPPDWERARSQLESAMQGDDAAGEVEVFDALEPRRLHHRLEGFLVGMHADRFGEIAVRRLVARDEAPEAGK